MILFKLNHVRNFKGKKRIIKIISNSIKLPFQPVAIRTLHRFKICVNPRFAKGVEYSLYKTGTYEAGTLHIIRKILKNGDVVIDIGANIGLMSLFSSRLIGEKGKVFCFEPEPDTYEILKKNIALNKLNNIFTYPFALGNTEEAALIYPNIEINRGAASILKTDGTNGKRIQIKKLDNFIFDNNVTNIKFIKIDVEGFELQVLRGAAALLAVENAPIICLEFSIVNLENNNYAEIYEYIKGINKYRLFKFSKYKDQICDLVEINDIDDLPEHDNVFCLMQHHLVSLKKKINTISI